MTDYAALTDAELNRRIAQALGYTVRCIEPPNQPGVREYLLIDPYGSSVYGAEEGAIGSEAGAWGHLPRWSNDVGAAMSLIVGSAFEISGTPVNAAESVFDVRIGGREQAWVSNKNLARAIALAWLAWKEAAGE